MVASGVSVGFAGGDPAVGDRSFTGTLFSFTVRGFEMVVTLATYQLFRALSTNFGHKDLRADKTD